VLIQTDRQHKEAVHFFSPEDVADDAFVRQGKRSLGTRDDKACVANPLTLAK
jgi:hypothetical protein